MEKVKTLEIFYAVTFTSLYLVSAERGEKGNPIVEKIAKRLGEKSKVGVGNRLLSGYNVGILDDRIILFNPSKSDRDPAMASIDHWGGNTSPVTALFLSEKDARKCLEEGFQIMWDPKYIESTREVLRAIGNNHPVFVISRSVPVKF